ncbi:MAG: asparagine synthase (glutamine-hydrolyzing) [Gammaproteobacteria bacterium]|jgi:asparagine synthase (glutamine-hydrolysing)
MCGIAALFSFTDINVASYIEKMTNIVRHRGPDDEGYAAVDCVGKVEFFGGCDTQKEISLTRCNRNKAKVALGHRRLTILDTSVSGHQPMVAQNDRYLIIFNGEVYNYIEIRKELQAKGYTFNSSTDTEVVLKSYIEWGKNCLSKFNGMFSFVIYDCIAKKTFIARDRFGQKPCYYWFSPAGFLAIASEIKQFTVLPGWDAKLNHQKGYDFLVFGLSDYDNETMFSEVYQLMGGECVEVRLDDIAAKSLPIERWYNLNPQKIDLPFDEACEHFRDLFHDAVKLRLRSDVDVGSALSGGLDSSSIVCMANKILKNDNKNYRQNTFSARSYDKKIDEIDYMQEVVNVTGVNAHYIYPEVDNLFKVLDEMTWHQDEPFLGTSIFAEWSVFNLVSTTSVKVTLDGHGADELLCGYHSFFENNLRYLLNEYKFFNFAQEMFLLKKCCKYGSRLLLRSLCPLKLKHFIRNRKLLKQAQKYIVFDFPSKNNPVDEQFEAASSLSDYSQILLSHTSMPVQLHWADRDSMCHSIESRAPFLDYRLVEFILGCPDNYKIKKALTKKILRNSLSNVLPQKIKDRRDKIGFATSEEMWVKRNPDLFRKLVDDAVKYAGGFLSKNVVKMMSDKIIAGKVTYDPWLWRVVNFGQWLKVFTINIY